MVRGVAYVGMGMVHVREGVAIISLPDPVYSKVQESLMKKHEEEKEGTTSVPHCSNSV